MTPKKIAKLMKLKGWSQSELGRELGVHRSTVHLWLLGARNPLGPAAKLMGQWLREEEREGEAVAAK